MRMEGRRLLASSIILWQAPRETCPWSHCTTKVSSIPLLGSAFVAPLFCRLMQTLQLLGGSSRGRVSIIHSLSLSTYTFVCFILQSRGVSASPFVMPLSVFPKLCKRLCTLLLAALSPVSSEMLGMYKSISLD